MREAVAVELLRHVVAVLEGQVVEGPLVAALLAYRAAFYLLPLLVAMALNKGVRGLPLYRAIFYLPSLLGGSVAIAVLWRQLFAYADTQHNRQLY